MQQLFEVTYLVEKTRHTGIVLGREGEQAAARNFERSSGEQVVSARCLGDYSGQWCQLPARGAA